MQQVYKATIVYDGTDYHGWQRQPKKKTIQGLIERALFKVTQKQIPVIGAGRTDAGVHAKGQTAHFRISLSIKERDLSKALNSLLPPDIRIDKLEAVNPDFHARRSALSKIYQYRINNSSSVSPFDIRYVHHWRGKLNTEEMMAGASQFIREDDFNPFSSNRFLHPVRKITRSEITLQDDEILYTVEASGFLRYMVRTMVGTLLEIGKGRYKSQEIDEIFRGKKRTLASPTAPPQGLTLLKVNYP